MHGFTGMGALASELPVASQMGQPGQGGGADRHDLPAGPGPDGNFMFLTSFFTPIQPRKVVFLYLLHR